MKVHNEEGQKGAGAGVELISRIKGEKGGERYRYRVKKETAT